MPGGRVAVGHPVDVASGTMFKEWNDLTLPGLLPLMVGRAYSTAMIATPGAPDLLGPGWRLNFQSHIRANLEGYAVHTPDGAETIIGDPDGRLPAGLPLVDPGAQLELRTLADGRIRLVRFGSDRDPLELLFSPMGPTRTSVLTCARLNPTNRIDLAYDAAGRPLLATHARSNRSIRFTYHPSGRLASAKVEGSDVAWIRYGYDAANRLAQVTARQGTLWSYDYDAAGRMSEEQGPTGSAHRFSYDSNSRCVHAVGSDGYEERWLSYDDAKRTTQVRDSLGHTTTYVWNERGQVIETTTPMGAVERSRFDALGRLVEHVDAGKTVARREYDELGRFCAVHLPDGRAVRLRHDDDHRVVELIDWNGESWRSVYDERGNRVRVEEPGGGVWTREFSASDDVMSLTDPLGNTLRFLRDAQGRMIGRRDWAGQTWRNAYDEFGWLVSETDPLGNTTLNERDAEGRVTAVRYPDGRTWAYGYDAGGRCTRTRAPDGTSTRNYYNSCGQLLASDLADGTRVEFRWTTEPGQLVEIKDARSHRYLREYDADGRPVAERFWDGRTVNYAYDGVGRNTHVVDAQGRSTEYEYDALGSLRVRRAWDGDEILYEYDGNLLPAKVTRGDHVLEFERDRYGNIVAEIQDGFRVESEFDLLRRRTAMRSQAGIAIDYGWGPTSCERVTIAGRTVTFHRDPMGREIARGLPDGGRIEQDFDPLGRIVAQRLHGPTTQSSVERRWYHDALGLLAGIDESTGRATRYHHDARGRLCAVVRRDGDTELYAHDATDNRTWSATIPAAYRAVPAQSARVKQIIDELAARRDIGAANDAVVAELGGAATRWDHGQGNQLKGASSPRGRMLYEYDEDDRLIRKQVLDATQTSEWSFDWTANGELAGALTPSGEQWRYEYDGLGRRIRRIGPGVDVRYIWDGLQLLHEIAADAAPTTWVNNPNGYGPIALVDTDVRYAVNDVVGRTLEWVTADGTTVWRSAASTWGDEPEPAANASLRFPGQHHDPETGFHYNFYRYYDPSVGRYVSSDPTGLAGGFNEFVYSTSPIEWIDPLGLNLRTPAGGPFVHTGPADSREISGAPRTPPLSPGPNHTVPERKCLATVGTPDGSQRLGFVSGMPDGSSVSGPNPPSRTGGPAAGTPFQGPDSVHPAVQNHTSGGMNGNWTHAEMHAMSFLLHNSAAFQGMPLQLVIDRAPCRGDTSGLGSCSSELRHLLGIAAGPPHNLQIDVLYREGGKLHPYPGPHGGGCP